MSIFSRKRDVGNVAIAIRLPIAFAHLSHTPVCQLTRALGMLEQLSRNGARLESWTVMRDTAGSSQAHWARSSW